MVKGKKITGKVKGKAVARNVAKNVAKTGKAPEFVINKEMTFGQVMEKHPKTADVFFKYGLFCVGCGAANFETIYEGASAHGFKDKQINALVKELNDKLSKK